MRRGAPQAVQVVDRFHLVQNLRQALEAFLLDRRLVLQDAAVSRAMALMPTASPVPFTPMCRGRRQQDAQGEHDDGPDGAEPRDGRPMSAAYMLLITVNTANVGAQITSFALEAAERSRSVARGAQHSASTATRR